MSRPPTARTVALGVVRRVTQAGAYSNLTLRSALARSGLSARDRAFASELVYGTLRRLPALDRALASIADRPLDAAPASALAVLRLGAYQLLFTRVPAHAAVAEAVELAEARHRGFVNAVLRRVASAAPAPPTGDTDDDVAVRTGLAPWAVRELRALLPAEEVEAAAGALGERARVTVRTNRCRTTPDELEERLTAAGVRATRGRLHAGSLVLDAGSPSELPGFADGWFAVQDEASALVVDALEPRPGERALDVCAGPGGKAADIACRIRPGGTLFASDVSPTRLGLVRRTAGRLGEEVHLLVQDGRRPALREGFDAVLVDAPCSGVGSARRRPELLWRVQRNEVDPLARLQVGIATAASRLLRPGGRLVYSACTFPRAETEGVCDALLRRVPELEPMTIAGPDGAVERLRLWPHRHGCDGMFVASFRRVDRAPR